ncbi:hypothetical protein IWW38_004446, partial [Coemansia aciculifera]
MLNSSRDKDKDEDPWSVVAEYLQSTPATVSHSNLPYTLDSQLYRPIEHAIPLTTGETTLSRIRLKRSATNTANEPPPLGLELVVSPTDPTNDYEWAAKRLRELSDLDSPDFASASQVWQIPNAELSALCRAHLSLNN